MLNCIVFQFNVCEYVTNAYLRSCTYSIVYAFTYFTEVKKKTGFYALQRYIKQRP